MHKNNFLIADVNEEKNQTDSASARLWRKLFLSDYNPELRPVLNMSGKVTVKLGVSLHQIIKVVRLAAAAEMHER